MCYKKIKKEKKRSDELLLAHFRAASQVIPIGTAQCKVTGCVFIEERVVEEMSTCGDGGTGWDERHFSESR